MQLVTIADVAKAAGVSLATVSRVKNRSRLVSEEKRNRVLKAMREVGYRNDTPEPSASRGKSRIIVVICCGFYLLDDILDGIMDQAKSLDSAYKVVVFQAGLAEDGYRRALEAVKLIPPDICLGLIFYNNICVEKELWSEFQSYPLVQVGEYNKTDPCFAVTTDDREAELEITRFLINKGRKRFAFISNSGLYTGKAPSQESLVKQNLFFIKREEGFRQALREAGLPFDEDLLLFMDFTPEGGGNGVRRLMELAEPPDAVVCVSDNVALGALRELSRLKIPVPGKVSVVGFDDADFAEFLNPPLTTIRQSYWELGAEAMRMLDALAMGKPQRGRITYIRHTLIERASG